MKLNVELSRCVIIVHVLLSVFQADFDKDLASVFRIMVLTLPSTYMVMYFTLWQTYVTKLEVALGGIMLVIQVSQFISSFLAMTHRYWPRRKHKVRSS